MSESYIHSKDLFTNHSWLHITILYIFSLDCTLYTLNIELFNNYFQYLMYSIPYIPITL